MFRTMKKDKRMRTINKISNLNELAPDVLRKIMRDVAAVCCDCRYCGLLFFHLKIMFFHRRRVRCTVRIMVEVYASSSYFDDDSFALDIVGSLSRS